MLQRLVLIGLLVFSFSLVSLWAPASSWAQIDIDPGTGQPVGNGSGTAPEIEEHVESVQAGEQGTNNVGYLSKNVLDGTLSSASCVLGPTIVDCAPTGGTVNGGLFESLIGYVGDLYRSPPASSQTYVADVLDSLNIAQPAYAQGIGFSALNPILSVWKTMRNIAYFFFVIALLVIGFMIMFRQKIGSQAVITAQQAIPTIITALLAVTFSYAIAGLLIDAMYLIMFLIAGLFGKVELMDGNVFQMGMKLVGNNVAGESGVAIGRIIEAALGGAAGAVAGFITNIGATLVILIVIVFNTFKLFFKLIQVYVELIINIAFAPVILMVGAIPGQDPFGMWIKNIVGNLAVFPVILLLLIMYDVISNSIVGTQGGFLPPYVAGYSAASVLPILAGLGLLLALPEAVDETRKAFGVQDSGFFANIMQKGLKNAWDKRGIGTAVGGMVAGAGAGVLGGAAVGGVNALRAKPGERMATFRRDVGRAVVGGVAGGAIAGGVPRMVAKPFSALAGFERDLDSLSQTGSRIREGWRGFKEAGEKPSKAAGTGGTGPKAPEDEDVT